MTQVNWISVQSAMPEEYKEVLIYIYSKADLVSIGKWENKGNGVKKWYEINSQAPWKDGIVTHWAELPEPPEN